MQPEQGQATKPSLPGQADQPQVSGKPEPPGRPHPSGPAGLAGRKVFRLPGAVAAWWAWVVLAVACLVDLTVSGRDHTSVEVALAVVLVTGVMYACALRPMVIADGDGVTVRNPLREHKVPWGSVTAVRLGESVQVHCAPEPGARRGKVIHSWALYAQRRSRIRAEFMEQRSSDKRQRGGFAVDDRLPAAAQRLARQPTAQIMARELDELAAKARNRGAIPGPRLVTWTWQPAAAILAPAIALVLVITLTH